MAEAAQGFSSSSEDIALPRVFGRLLLLKLIARGGMGDIYLAATTGIEGAERPCIVKTVRRDHIHDGSFLARFLDEARVQSQLNHPGVAQVLEASTDEVGEPYTVVEYVEGRSLADVRQRSLQLGIKVMWPDALAAAMEVVQALAHVHERSGSDGAPLGIVHRDLSPQNVMVGYSGEVKLIDFGTARGQNRRCHTVAGVVFAKPGYVAPEVARHEVGDGRIDLYALGIMLWELCQGQRFFSGDPQKHLEDAAAGHVVIPPIAQSLGAPSLLDDVIHRLTANQPDDRYESAQRAIPDMARVLSLAPAGKLGERSVRARISTLMHALWPREPAKSRAEFGRLLREARDLIPTVATPSAGKVVSLVASQMAPEDPSMLPGTPYRLLRKIGEGSSGTVHEAEHTELGRKVALKLLSPEHASATDAIDRFRREARAIASISHPNLVTLYDFGKSLDGRVFLAMDLLSGETLDKKIADKKIAAAKAIEAAAAQSESKIDSKVGFNAVSNVGPKSESKISLTLSTKTFSAKKADPASTFSWQEIARLGVEVCRALEVAHAAKLVHRDLKPANLFLTSNGGIKLLDFGVAMALADTTFDHERRQKGFAIFGTPEYMAPEQVAGEPVDGRCDLYALGAVLYEMATGTPIFEGSSSVIVMGKQLREAIEPPRVRAPLRPIPEALEAIIMKALSKKPDQRFANAITMRESIEVVLGGPAKRTKRTKMTVAAAIGAIAVIGGIFGVARASRSHAAPEITKAPEESTAVLAAAPKPPVTAEPETQENPAQTAAKSDTAKTEPLKNAAKEPARADSFASVDPSAIKTVKATDLPIAGAERATAVAAVAAVATIATVAKGTPRAQGDGKPHVDVAHARASKHRAVDSAEGAKAAKGRNASRLHSDAHGEPSDAKITPNDAHSRGDAASTPNHSIDPHTPHATKQKPKAHP